MNLNMEILYYDIYKFYSYICNNYLNFVLKNKYLVFILTRESRTVFPSYRA